MQQCNISEIPLNIQYLFNEFVKQVNNVLENGYCGNEKLVDSINNRKFTEWIDIISSGIKNPHDTIIY